MQFVPTFDPFQQWRQANMTFSNISNLKLCVRPLVPALQSKDIINYFASFGEVIGCELRPMNNGGLAIVYFRNEGDFQLVLQKHYHRIQRYIVAVEELSDQSTEANSVNCVKENAAVELLDMNDTILMKVFDFLGVNELCQLAKTCKRFKQISDQSFALKFDKITVRAGNRNAEEIFRSFGHLATSLDIDIIEPECHWFGLLAQICSSNLRNLSIWMNYDHHTNLIRNIGKLSTLFSHLQRLDIYCRDLFDLQTTIDLLTSCLNLESLSINCSSDTFGICNQMFIHFPKLQELKFHLNRSIDDEGLSILLTYNAGIKRLYLDECPSLSAKVFSIIQCHLPNLEELSLGLFQLQHLHPIDLMPLANLRCLKSLTIILGGVLPLIDVIHNANIQIERLELWYVDIQDAHIASISAIPSIRQLTLSRNIKDLHLNILAAKLPLLNELQLDDSNNLTVEGLESMLFHAKNLKHLGLRNIQRIKISDKKRLLEFAERHLNKKDLTIEIA